MMNPAAPRELHFLPLKTVSICNGLERNAQGGYVDGAAVLRNTEGLEPGIQAPHIPAGSHQPTEKPAVRNRLLGRAPGAGLLLYSSRYPNFALMGFIKGTVREASDRSK